MLDGVGLIHMNGRVYDPTVGRFLSVDPVVRDAAAPQSWNGYGYVEGRVLSATDPSGYCAGNLPGSACQILPEFDPIFEVTVEASRLFRSWETSLRLQFDTVRDSLARNFDSAFKEPSQPASENAVTNPTLQPRGEELTCEGGAPQLIDANITAAVATARVLAANATDGSVPPIGARGVIPVASARIAPYERIAANADWAKVAKTGARLGTAFNIYNVVSGFRSSVGDGLFATADMAVGTALAFAPIAGVPVSIAYSAHGGSKSLVRDIKYVTGQCRAP